MVSDSEYNHYMSKISGRGGTGNEMDQVLAAAARLQGILKDAVLVGGTAASAHAGHRLSLDADHELTDLRERFDQVLDALESTDGWATARVKRPVLILGNLDGIDTGIRQLIRQQPLEVQEFEAAGKRLRIPTLEEMLRIKAWLILRRNATRDFLDFVALADKLGPTAAEVAIGIDHYYRDQRGSGGSRISTQLAKQLADPAPYDLSEVDLSSYRKLVEKWRDFGRVAAACRQIATQMLASRAKGN